MPESFSAEQLIERIILLNKVEEGLKQAEEGKVYSIEESKKMNKRWLK
jgi:predicted transcriptional regulator